ncbi:MAG: hypothetical protein ACR2KD_00205 [Thermoleophilaceae bacterium]
MVVALEVAVVVLVTIAVLAVLETRRRRRLEEAWWTVETTSLAEGGFAVELRCFGQPPQRTAMIPPDLPAEEFSSALADARAEAEHESAALNAGRPRSR